MTFLSHVLEAAYCSGTHHKLAFHALDHLTCPQAEDWRKFFLSRHERYLEGSKAPDKQFKDFKNHVIHVNSGNWGGAPAEAAKWYEDTVERLSFEDWEGAAFSAGVLSHYVTDPVMPFHTAQSEAESNIHRAVEWSIAKSYDPLKPKIQGAVSLAKSKIQPGTEASWLEELILAAARYSNQSYDILIEHYDFRKGSKNPPEGLNQVCRFFVADLLGYAQVLFSRILERAIREADVVPPRVLLTPQSVIASLEIPVAWVTRKMADSEEKKLVKAMYDEFREKGKVDETLTEDVWVVRELVQSRDSEPAEKPRRKAVEKEKAKEKAKEVALEEGIKAEPGEKGTPAPAKRPAGRPAPRPRGLSLDAPLQAAPSIGKKTAARLAKAGLRTVKDLLVANPEAVAEKVKVRYITAEAIRDWQDQARLAHLVPELRGHDVQILVGGGIRTLSSLAGSEPEEVLANVLPFVESDAGKRVVRPGDEPDLGEVTQWVAWAESAA